MGLISSIQGANNAASAIAKAVTATGVGANKNTSGLDAASVNEVLKGEKEDAEKEVSSGPSSSKVASKTSGIFNSNRPATQSPFPVTPVATNPNSSQQQAPTMPPGMGGMGSLPKMPGLPESKPNPNNKPWKGKGAKEEENKTPNPTTPEPTPPGTANKATEVKDEKKIEAIKTVFDEKTPGAADQRKALLFIYTKDGDKGSSSLRESLKDPANRELLTKHYNPVHIQKDANGKITIGGKAPDPKIALLINTKFEKAGAVIVAHAGDGKFKETEIKGDSLDTKQLIAAKDSNLQFYNPHTQEAIQAHLQDDGFRKYLESNPSPQNKDLLASIDSYNTPEPGTKMDLKSLGEDLHAAWEKYLSINRDKPLPLN